MHDDCDNRFKPFCIYTDLFSVLRDHLKEIEAEWRYVGVKLGVPKAQLDNIQTTNAHQGGETQCMAEMLSFWLQSTPKESQWDNIIAALKEVNKNLADKLEREYLRTSQASSAAGNHATELQCRFIATNFWADSNSSILLLCLSSVL